jgi:hypothetical protein
MPPNFSQRQDNPSKILTYKKDHKLGRPWRNIKDVKEEDGEKLLQEKTF